jgi:transcriptional regulator with XRE-family HTH domain
MANPDPHSYEAGEHRRALGLRIRTLRRERNWTQENLAEAAEMDRSYLADIESGRRNPTLDVLWRIAKGLSVGIRDLF